APLTDRHRAQHEEFAEFVRREVAPHAAQWDRDQSIPPEVIAKMARCGYFGCTLPPEHGGQGWGAVVFGLLNAAFGRGSSALTNVLTVQAMVAMALVKWGSAAQKREWLPRLAAGEVIGGFALTEPDGGSALDTMATRFSRGAAGGRLTLNGSKKWISCAQFAGVFLVFGKLDDQPVACL